MPAQPGARARNTIRGAILAGTAVLLLAPSPAWAQRQELTDDLSGFTQTVSVTAWQDWPQRPG